MDNLNSRYLDEFRVNACDVVNFKLVRSNKDLNSKDVFHPEYTHQIFGESEQIFGYRDLNVNISYMAGSLSTFIDVSYSSCVDPKISKGALPDDIFQLISKAYDYTFHRNLENFTKTFEDECNFKPHGIKRHNYHIVKDKVVSKYFINFIEHGMDGFEDFLEYHRRMESFLLFFIDGASFISTEDSQWCYYTIYEKLDQQNDHESKFSFVGYMTVYKFYAYPTNLRPRVSQVLVLPPFRNNGHATQLLQTFYRDFVQVPNVVDITVEDPSDEFQRIRDFLDCKRCIESPEVMEILKQDFKAKNGHINDSKSNILRFREMVKQKLKLNRYQAKRVYEILRLYLLPRTKSACNAFKNALNSRTEAYFQRVRPDAMRGSSLISKRPNTNSTSTTAGDISSSSSSSSNKNINNVNPLKKVFDDAADEYFTNQLQEEVEVLLKIYQDVVDKLDRAIVKDNQKSV